MAMAPKGYTNLEKRIGGLPLYFHRATNEFALMITPATNSQVSEFNMRRFATVPDAEQWVKEQQSTQQMEGIQASPYNIPTFRWLTASYDRLAQYWIESKPRQNERHHSLIKPSSEWEEQAIEIVEEYTEVKASLLSLERRWKALVETAPRLEPPVIGTKEEE